MCSSKENQPTAHSQTTKTKNNTLNLAPDPFLVTRGKQGWIGVLFCVMSLYFLLLITNDIIVIFLNSWVIESRKYQKIYPKNSIFVSYLTIYLSENISCMIKFVRKLFRRNSKKMSENISAEVFPLKSYPPKFLGVNVLTLTQCPISLYTHVVYSFYPDYGQNKIYSINVPFFIFLCTVYVTIIFRHKHFLYVLCSKYLVLLIRFIFEYISRNEET